MREVTNYLRSTANALLYTPDHLVNQCGYSLSRLRNETKEYEKKDGFRANPVVIE